MCLRRRVRVRHRRACPCPCRYVPLIQPPGLLHSNPSATRMAAEDRRMADLTGRMMGAMQADVPTFTEIENDPAAMGQAVTVIAIAGVAALIGNLFRSGVIAGVLAIIASLIGYALFSLLVFLIGTK